MRRASNCLTWSFCSNVNSSFGSIVALLPAPGFGRVGEGVRVGEAARGIHERRHACCHVRFKIHDGYESKSMDDDKRKRKPSEKLTAEKLELLDSATIERS
eukprot:scaffold8290_cov136-Isochrysis_galbana.AAC.5